MVGLTETKVRSQRAPNVNSYLKAGHDGWVVTSLGLLLPWPGSVFSFELVYYLRASEITYL